MSDLDLLQQFVRTESQDAFTALVRRHVNLVNSAALRQVRSTQLAEDITQSVFLDLARRAAQLDPGQPLAAWLFTVTRRTAIDALRGEIRRAAREQTAAELASMKTPSPSWPRIREVLDEAMENLDDADRAALLLRFFENQSLREVGAALGLSEDTAQKRVSRALDRLRVLLDRRGIAAASAAALATDLSAHAVEAAPASLTAALSSTGYLTTASTLASTPAAFTSASTTGLPALPKLAAILASTGVLGFVTFETTTFARQRAELATLPAQTASLATTLARLRSEQTATSARLPAARAAFAEASRPRLVDAELEAAIAAWLARAKRLQELATQRSDLGTPDFQLLTEREWLSAAREAKLETEPDIQEAFNSLSKTARENFAEMLDAALDRYLAAHAGNLPDSPLQLSAHATPPLPPELLRNYEMLQRGPLGAAPKDAWLLAEKPAIAARHGNRVYVSATARGTAALDAATGSTP